MVSKKLYTPRMDKITQAATGEVLDRIQWLYDNEETDYLSDLLHEVADSHVPVYTNDIIELAKEDFELVLAVSELCQSDATPLQQITCNIYDHINDFLHCWADEQKLEADFSEVLN